MTASAGLAERVRFLVDVVMKESLHLQQTDARLFISPLDAAQLSKLDTDPVFAERIDAFVARFSRLQDTVDNKLLPAVLPLASETTRSAIENLDRAEKLGWVVSADEWISLRRLRNQMIHEYIEDRDLLAEALNLGHRSVPVLREAADAPCSAADSLLARHA